MRRANTGRGSIRLGAELDKLRRTTCAWPSEALMRRQGASDIGFGPTEARQRSSGVVRRVRTMNNKHIERV